MGFLTDKYELEVPEEGESCDFMLGGLVVPSKLVCNPIDYVLDAGTPLGKLIFDAIHNCRCEEKGLIGQIVTLRDAIYLIINVEQNSIAHLLEITGRTRFCISKTVIKFRFELSERFRTFKDICFAELVLRRNTRQTEKFSSSTACKSKPRRSDNNADEEVTQEEVDDAKEYDRLHGVGWGKRRGGSDIVGHLLKKAQVLPASTLQTIYEDSMLESLDPKDDLTGAFRCLPPSVKDEALKDLLKMSRQRSDEGDGAVVSGKRPRGKEAQAKDVATKATFEDSIYVLDLLQEFLKEEIETNTLSGVGDCCSRDQILPVHDHALQFDIGTLEIQKEYAACCSKSLSNPEDKKLNSRIIILRQQLIGRQKISLNTWKEASGMWETITTLKGEESKSRKRHCRAKSVSHSPMSLVYENMRARSVLLRHLCSQIHERHHFKKASGDFYAITMLHKGVTYVVLSQVAYQDETLKFLKYTQQKLEGKVSFSISEEEQRERLLKVYMSENFETLYQKISVALKKTMSFGDIRVKTYLRKKLAVRDFCILPRFLSAGCNNLDHPVCGFRGSFLGGFKNWACSKNRVSVVTCLLPSRYADLFGLPFDAPNGLLAGQFDAGSTGGAAYARICY